MDFGPDRLVGEIIVRYEQNDSIRAEYGEQTLKQLSKELSSEFGKGFSRSNLQNMRAFYLNYKKCQTLSGKLNWSHYCELLSISDKDKRSFYEKEAVNSNCEKSDIKTNGKTNGKTNNKTNGKYGGDFIQKLTETEYEIVEQIKQNPTVTQKELAKKLNLSDSGVRYAMRELREKGMLIRIGSNRNGGWKLIP